jgi:diketogulonate reductase-like aldo/keto reductase
MILKESFTLPNGVEIPKLGLGTWMISDEDVAQAVKDAVKIGYRHIDTAQAYGNERGVGEGARTCGVNREDIFVTTKLVAEVKTYAEVDFAISDGDMEFLKHMEKIKDYGEAGMMPVFGGKLPRG